VRGHVEMQDLAPPVIDREEAVEQAEGDGGHGEEVQCRDRLAMVSQEREPVLGGVASPRQPARQIAGHGAFGDVEAQLEQFAVDSGSAPGGVLARHPPDDLEHVAIDSAPAATRAQAPVEPEAGAMPADDGLGLDHDQRIGPARPKAPQSQPEQAVEVVQAGPWMFALEHGDLLAQGKNLQTKIMACAKERAQVGEEREHAVLAIVDKGATARLPARLPTDWRS